MLKMSSERVEVIGSRLLEIRGEVLRKGLHLLIALSPTLAFWNFDLTVFLLSLGIVVYVVAESLRLQGREVAFISLITRLASRDRDKNRAVLGPVTLGLGALLCLMMYPEPAATVGIYALAFGDGFSSLIGKLVGRVPLPFTGGKTLEGSLAAFVAVWIAVSAFGHQPLVALAVAAVATLLEALPLKDLDNLVIPLGTGLFYLLVVHVS
jgi:dolichol kinase